MNNFPELMASPWKARKFLLSDLPMVEMASKDSFIPLISTIPKDYSEDEGIAYIKRQWSRFDSGEGYAFAVAKQDTDQAVGFAFLCFRGKDRGRASLGYWIIEGFRGQGAAKTVLKAIVNWAQRDLGIERLELYVEPWNIASLKTAKALGFEEEGLMRRWEKIGNERKDMYMMSLIIPTIQ
jgi:RimJ/RimL family protein N-acetyltransferase